MDSLRLDRPRLHDRIGGVIVALHAPPVGPAGLLCFAAAVALLARSRRLGAQPAVQ